MLFFTPGIAVTVLIISVVKAAVLPEANTR